VFGTHQVSTIFWEGVVGLKSAPLHKGLMPVNSDYALLWLVVSLLAGLVHLTIGYAFGFVDDLVHGTREALFENGSWLLMMVGVWTWIFSFHAQQSKPTFVVGEEATLNGNPIPLGFAGLPESVGLVGLGTFGVGLLMLAIADFVEVVEFLQVIVNVLSYARLAAVLLAKAGMAFVVNLLFFGVYVTGEGEHAAWHFGIGHMPQVGEMVHGHAVTSIMFPGLIHSGTAGLVGGLAVLVIGHLLVLALGVTSAGLQAVRLEYVEFFGKFYEGNGRPYDPFGYRPEFTSGD
jgi:V/A-type H+-transporting ATPase subunit I